MVCEEAEAMVEENLVEMRFFFADEHAGVDSGKLDWWICGSMDRISGSGTANLTLIWKQRPTPGSPLPACKHRICG